MASPFEGEAVKQQPMVEPENSVADPRTVMSAECSAAVPDPEFAPSGRYILGDEIARGGMGVVYRAIDTAFGCEVAVKVLQDKFDPTSGAARRFADEARITGQLQHPAIPPSTISAPFRMVARSSR